MKRYENMMTLDGMGRDVVITYLIMLFYAIPYYTILYYIIV